MRCAGVLAALLLTAAAHGGDKEVADLDLSAPFGLPPGWRLVATQGPDIPDPVMDERDRAPGEVKLCLRSPDGRCDPALAQQLGQKADFGDLYNTPHFLIRAAIVRPRGPVSAPLLVVQDGSLFSVDGGRVVVLQILRWDGANRRFERVLRREVGGPNNNEEVRYIDAGPLRGAVVDAVPTENAPFGYWITVHQPGPSLAYRQTLRFRSETRYGDGNSLAVVDSEMPNILQWLGLWRPGQRLPLPAGPCPTPRLRSGALWCK